MIHRLIRIFRIVVVLILGLAFSLGALGGILLQVAAHFSASLAIKPPSHLESANEKRSRFGMFKLGAVLSVAALLLVVALGGLIVILSGVVPIAASSGHWPITEWFLQLAMRRSISTHSLGIVTPPLDDSELILKGATHYEIGCRPCHGSPDMPLPRIPAQMTPHPPDLRHSVNHLEPRELFYVVKHGVKFTGMPAWPALQRDDEVWAMVAFLEQLTHLEGAAYRKLVDGDAAAIAPINALARLPSVPPAVTQSCARCHGIDGIGRGNGAFPKLAGQRQGYLENALKAYASGQRHSGTMGPLSTGLDAEAIREVARYYANLPPAEPPVSSRSEAAVERGRAIAQHGIPAQRVASCVDCHLPDGRRYNPNYPTLGRTTCRLPGASAGAL
jgi:cytochrome c553